MAHVHFFLNPKGGTGKSLFSYITAQYLISLGADVTCIDCDPITPTLIEYKALNPKRLDIMEGTNIEKTKFDRFVELIVAGSEDQHLSSTTEPRPSSPSPITLPPMRSSRSLTPCTIP